MHSPFWTLQWATALLVAVAAVLKRSSGTSSDQVASFRWAWPIDEGLRATAQIILLGVFSTVVVVPVALLLLPSEWATNGAVFIVYLLVGFACWRSLSQLASRFMTRLGYDLIGGRQVDLNTGITTLVLAAAVLLGRHLLSPVLQGYKSPKETASFLAIALVAAISEELLFRVLLQRSLRSAFGKVSSIGLSATVFALVHLYSGTALISVLWLGVLLGLAYEETRSVIPITVAHFTFNLM